MIQLSSEGFVNQVGFNLLLLNIHIIICLISAGFFVCCFALWAFFFTQVCHLGLFASRYIWLVTVGKLWMLLIALMADCFLFKCHSRLCRWASRRTSRAQAFICVINYTCLFAALICQNPSRKNKILAYIKPPCSSGDDRPQESGS